MDAADIGWSVLKAPLMPGSLRQTSDKIYTAEFSDKAGENDVPVKAEVSEWEDKFGEGKRINAWMGSLKDSANMVTAMRHGNAEEAPDFFVSRAKIEEELQRQGRATALYDMIAAIIEREERGRARLTPGYRSDDAVALWDAVSPDGQWRVRDKLWADGDFFD
mgnify:FL=1